MAPKLKCPSESSHLSELRPSVVRCIIEHVGEHYVTLGPYFPCDRRDSGCPWFWRNRRSLHWNREGTVLHCSCDLRHSASAGSYRCASRGRLNRSLPSPGNSYSQPWKGPTRRKQK